MHIVEKGSTESVQFFCKQVLCFLNKIIRL
jgi:hypothetical protein